MKEMVFAYFDVRVLARIVIVTVIASTCRVALLLIINVFWDRRAGILKKSLSSAWTLARWLS